MVFSSIIFIFYFLPVFLVFYYLAGARNAALLTGSLVFYTWGEGRYVLLLSALVGLNYCGARWVETAAPERRQRLLAGFVVLDLAVLGVFKYAGFLLSNLGSLTGWPLPKLEFALPLGISFFTFQLVSYLIDVERGADAGERSPLRLATYIMMFPHLIAGPIVRYADIARGIEGPPHDRGEIGLGVQYFIVGLSQKVLIANVVAPAADHAFGLRGLRSRRRSRPGSAPWPTPCRSISISAAIRTWRSGSPSCSGFHFPKNFDYPYAATLDHRVLAALAHLAVVLVPRLRLHPARRQPARHGQDLAQPR